MHSCRLVHIYLCGVDGPDAMLPVEEEFVVVNVYVLMD